MKDHSSTKEKNSAKKRANINLERRSEIGRELRHKKLNKILTNTIAYLADRSFASTRIEDIAKASGVTSRTFHNYFPQKEDFADAVGLLLYNVAAHTAGPRPAAATNAVDAMAYKILVNGQFSVHQSDITRVSFDLYLSRYPGFQSAWNRTLVPFYSEYEAGVRDNHFVQLEQNTLSDYFLTPMYFRWYRVCRRSKR